MPTKKATPAKKDATKKVKHTMDRKLVSLKQKWEPKDVVRWFKKKFGKAGFTVTVIMVKDAVREVGRSQKKVKDYLERTHGPRNLELAKTKA